MTKQEVLAQVAQQLEQADFTPTMVALLKQSTGNVLNRAKQSLDATLQENSNPQIDTVLNSVGNEITQATTEWIDASTGQLVVFPEGTRFVSKDQTNLIVVVEEKPQVRTINFRCNNERRSYAISLPYIYFIACFQNQANNNYRFVQLRLCSSKTPITSLDSQVCPLPLPNIHTGHTVCTGNMNLPDANTTIVQKMNAVISGYWSSEFNTDLTQYFSEFVRSNRLVNNIESYSDYFVAFSNWQQSSRGNPLYAIQPNTVFGRAFTMNSLIPVDNSSRTSRTAVMNRIKTQVTNNMSQIGGNIIQTIRDFNIVDENRDRSHVETLKNLYNRVITSAYDNLWNNVNAVHEQQKAADLQQIQQQRQQLERSQRDLETTRQRNESSLNRAREQLETERNRWLQEKTNRENQLAVAHQYLTRKLAEVGSTVQQAINPNAPASNPAPVAAAAPVTRPQPVPQGEIPNPPGFTGRGRRRLEPWTVGSIYRKRQSDGSYIVHVWNGFDWVRQ